MITIDEIKALEFPEYKNTIEQLSKALEFETLRIAKFGVSNDPALESTLKRIRKIQLIKAYRKTFLAALINSLILSALIGFPKYSKRPGSPRSD